MSFPVTGNGEDDLVKKLDSVSLSNKEEGDTEIVGKDILVGEEDVGRSLFGKIIGDRKAMLLGVKRTMSAIWRIQQPMEVRELDSNFFQFVFQSKEDLPKVAARNTWLFENQYLILKEWREGMSSNHLCFDEVVLWVQVHNVPLNWICTDVGLKVDNVFKGVKNVVIHQSSNVAGRHLKLLAVIDLNEAIPRCTHIRLENQRVRVNFKYERLVNLCYYYGMISHLDRICKKTTSDIGNHKMQEGQYGEWLKASMFNSSSHSGPSSGSGLNGTNSPPPKPNSAASNAEFKNQEKQTGESSKMQELEFIPDGGKGESGTEKGKDVEQGDVGKKLERSIDLSISHEHGQDLETPSPREGIETMETEVLPNSLVQVRAEHLEDPSQSHQKPKVST
ncbi:Unknown protein [Striga hermonthica]|uniref:DUF4283 domain-containing protein n=1 Tax=Striga hermonthica TaxID=68872 RepID=A0A9N7MVC9_STRHE|nr:Unknown protein [Striga hermonthica]